MLKGTIRMPVAEVLSRAEQLEAVLRQIVDRAHRVEQAGSTYHLTQKVPAGLIEQAREILESKE